MKHTQGGAGSNNTLQLDADGASYGYPTLKERKSHFVFSANKITECEVLDGESRVTVTRLATLGLMGAGMKKNRTWIRLVAGKREATFELRVSAAQVRTWVSQFEWARQQPASQSRAPGLPDLEGQLRGLAELHASGALSLEEFQQAKKALLAPGAS